MSSIPEELNHEILLRLPVKSLLVSKSVCKNWYALICNPSFINTHLSRITQRNNFSLMHKSFDGFRYIYEYAVHPKCYESLLLLRKSDQDDAGDMLSKGVSIFSSTPETRIDLLCSCNGLVCLNFLTESKQRLCLWNPATREYKKLPEAQTSQGIVDFTRCGLGYDEKINDYKFVAFVKFGSRSTYQTLIYTLGSNSWKKIQNISDLSLGMRQSGVVVNGSLSWIGARRDYPTRFIFSFDISNERSNNMQLPKQALEEGRCYCLGVLEGCLSVVAYNNSDNDRRQVVIWIMQEHGVQESWTKHTVIKLEGSVENNHYLRLTWYLKNGEILLGIGWSDLVVYDPKHKSSADLQGLKIISGESYFESLVSLQSGVYVGGAGNGQMEFPIQDEGKEHKEQQEEIFVF